MQVSSGFAFGKRFVAQGSRVQGFGVERFRGAGLWLRISWARTGCILSSEPLNAEPLILKLTETIVESLPVDQFGMGSGFDDAAPVEDDDPVGMAYG